ncbi:MAG TPA: alpha/beta hydrolase [Niabella sp.]|nr:alpha/beta hydrolase [Niabella sp.]
MSLKQYYLVVYFLSGFVLLNLTTHGQNTNSAKTDTLNISVDNHHMFLYSTGKGIYTIVMEAGLGANHTCWKAVDTVIAKRARVITYDRPGYLKSDSCSKTRDAITVSRELREALTKANIPPPYIMAGWSLGGAFVRVFAGMYPNDVKGLILVDPAPEESYARFSKESPESLSEDSVYLAEVLSSKRTGEKGEVIAYDSSMNQARISDNRYSIPTKLLIAPYGKASGKYIQEPSHPINRIWTEELIKWAEKKQNVEYRIVEKSGHHIAKDRPDVVANAILDLIEKIKQEND